MYYKHLYYKPSIQIIQAWARNSEGTSLYKSQMDHRIPQVLFPARAVASYPRRIRLNQARLKAEVHVITWNPWSPGPVLFCGLLNFRWMSVAYFLPKIVPTLCNCIIYWKKMKKKTCEVVKWCARKTNIPGGPWDLGKLGAFDPSQDSASTPTDFASKQ